MRQIGDCADRASCPAQCIAHRNTINVSVVPPHGPTMWKYLDFGVPVLSFGFTDTIASASVRGNDQITGLHAFRNCPDGPAGKPCRDPGFAWMKVKVNRNKLGVERLPSIIQFLGEILVHTIVSTNEIAFKACVGIRATLTQHDPEYVAHLKIPCVHFWLCSINIDACLGSCEWPHVEWLGKQVDQKQKGPRTGVRGPFYSKKKNL